MTGTDVRAGSCRYLLNQQTLSNLESKIHPHAFEYIRAQIGILNLSDLDSLIRLPKDDIEYNKFDN